MFALKTESKAIQVELKRTSCFHSHAMDVAAAITSPQINTPQDAAQEKMAEQLPLLQIQLPL